jgi:hypothetical protein
MHSPTLGVFLQTWYAYTYTSMCVNMCLHTHTYKHTYLVGSRGAGSDGSLPVGLVDEHGTEVADLRIKKTSVVWPNHSTEKIRSSTHNVDDTEDDTASGPHGQERARVVVAHVVLDSSAHEVLPDL